jgi:hypothetical protein
MSACSETNHLSHWVSVVCFSIFKCSVDLEAFALVVDNVLVTLWDSDTNLALGVWVFGVDEAWVARLVVQYANRDHFWCGFLDYV